ncbi:pci domain-containing protein [Botrytis cinerea]
MRVVRILSLVAQSVMVVRGTSLTCQTQIDPSSVSVATRSQWCTSQVNTCGTLCGGVTDENSCDITSLCYECTCTSNSSSPALQLYISTIPFFVCEQRYMNCILAGEDDPAAQKICRAIEEENCGTLDPDTVSSFASTLPSRSTGIPTPIPQMTSQTETSTGTEDLITSTTKTVTPTPTGTTTVWTTSTASSGSESSGNGTTRSGSSSESAGTSATRSLSSSSRVTDVSSGSGSTATSTVSRTSSSGTATGTAIRTSTPSTISEGGAERMRIGATWMIWGVLMAVGGFGFM